MSGEKCAILKDKGHMKNNYIADIAEISREINNACNAICQVQSVTVIHFQELCIYPKRSLRDECKGMLSPHGFLTLKWWALWREQDGHLRARVLHLDP